MSGRPVALNRWFVFYTFVIFLPVVYMLLLPSEVVKAILYFAAFAVPALAFILLFLYSMEDYRTILTLLAISILVLVSLLVGDGIKLSGLNVIRAIKYYLCPVLIFLSGYSFARFADRRTVLRTLLVVFCVHLAFSMLFVIGALYSPVYDVNSSLYTENWVVTSGVLTAFTGLTLSKFDLAYQVGFILSGLLLFWNSFPKYKITKITALLVGLILLGCTYNKTMLAVVILTLVLLPIRRLLAYSRLLGLVVLSGTCVIIGLLALQFTARELVLTDIAIFLSPQTLLSRFAIWGEYARFNTINMLQGYGAGFFDAKSVIIDNQFLYSYLELGAIPTVAYFVLAASLIYRNSNRSIEVLVIMFLLGCVFLFGDMLSSIMVMYTIGVLFGTTDDRVRLQTAGNCTHTVPTGNTERVE